MPTKDPQKNREQSRRWREANPDKVREAARRFREANPEIVREWDRSKREANPEKYREQARRWRKANQDRHRETRRKWTEANPEKARELDRRKRNANPERYREIARRWANANPEKRLEISRRWAKANQGKRRALCLGYRAKKRGASPAGRCVTSLALEARRALFGYRCAWCSDGLAEHDDHLVPLVLGGLHVPENIVPACARCNSRKSGSPPEQWYLSQPFFNQERWAHICKHTNLSPSGAIQLTLELDA